MDVSIIFLVILILFVSYYFAFVVRKPSVDYSHNSFNQKVVDAIPALNRRYFPTPWLFNTHLQLIVLGFIKGFAKPLEYDRSDLLKTPDGGEVSVDWVGLDLPDDRPTMVVLHTISGNPQSMRGFVRYVAETMGWRVALCVRRGHGDMKLTVPSFNTMGNTDDFALQITHIQSCFPDSPLYATGISAGSGVLAHYLGKVGVNTPIQAAVAYCPAYDMRNAFSRAIPFYSRMMAKKLKKLFVHPNEETFKHLDSFHKLKEVEDLHEFHQLIYGMAGNESVEDYMLNSNPSEVFDDIKIPVLILNAKDDPVCHIDNVYEHKHRMDAMDNVILVLTDRGSHCAYFEGISAKPWANKLIKQYFSAVHQLSSNKNYQLSSNKT